jgi:hypothetical protein
MSLKTVHIIFVVAATLMTFGFGAWSLVQFFRVTHAIGDLVWGIGSVLLGAAMIWYGRYVFRKLKNMNYL